MEYAGGPRTLKEFMEAVWAFGERDFLVGEDGARTYREFFAEACALARRFAGEYGLRPGDRAGIVMRNHPEWQIAFWGAQLAGLVAVPLNAWWTEVELTYALEDCTPKVLLVDGERLPRVEGWAARAGARTVVFRQEGREAGEGQEGREVREGQGAGEGQEGRESREGEAGSGRLGARVEWYEDFGPADPFGAPPAVEVGAGDDATIMYTSGTTGRPKGAVATQLAQAGAAVNPRFHAAEAALARGAVPGMEPAPVVLMTYPFFHAAAFTAMYSAMSVGGTVVLMRKWDAERALALVAEHRVTHFAGVPTTALQLLDAAERKGGGLETLVNLATGGAAAPGEIVARLTARHGRRIEPRNGYGLTETCGGVLAGFGDDYRNDPGCVGRPAPAVEVRIAGPAGEELPEGAVGELWLRGQSLVRGYWRDEPATAAAFRDGWFRTGDLARTREGRVSIVDRITDMVVRGGENVYCAEVEGVLHAHPEVADAAVFGVPHPLLGEEVAAVVQLREGATVTPDGLRRHVGARLAAFKTPARLLLGEVPRSPIGKILKRELRARYGETEG